MTDRGKRSAIYENTGWENVALGYSSGVNGNTGFNGDSVSPPEPDYDELEAKLVARLTALYAPPQVIIPCQYCGQWGALHCACPKCGGAIASKMPELPLDRN